MSQFIINISQNLDLFFWIYYCLVGLLKWQKGEVNIRFLLMFRKYVYVWSEEWSGRPNAHSYWWISFLSASILACGVLGFEGYLPVPFGLSQPQPSTFRAWPRSVVSSLPSRAGRVVLKDPGQRKGIICQCAFYMAVGIFGIIASRPGGRKKNPF